LLNVTGANTKFVHANTVGGAGIVHLHRDSSGSGYNYSLGHREQFATRLESECHHLGSGIGCDLPYLNGSPSSAAPSQLVTVTANLTDQSANPQVAVPGETVNFTIGGVGCGATTDSKGNASCQLTPSGPDS